MEKVHKPSNSDASNCLWMSVLSIIHISVKFLFLFLGVQWDRATSTDAATGLLHQQRMMMDDDERGAVAGMIDRLNLSTR
jgi:hypothetical protein